LAGRPTREAGSLKVTSVLRRVPPGIATVTRELFASEGDVCLFEIALNSTAALVEDPAGRYMTLLPGDRFLATPGHRASTRWVVGQVPPEGLIPGETYWVLSDAGVVGELISDSPRRKEHLVEAKYLGVSVQPDGSAVNIAQFAIKPGRRRSDRGAALFLVLGTSSEVGKTTAAIAVVRTLKSSGLSTVCATKMTGTAAFNEIAKYRDFGATHTFDSVDFGLPTTYTPDLDKIQRWFDYALNVLLSECPDALVIECGGDIFGANVPTFLDCLKAKRQDFKVILAAPDALAAAGAKRVLAENGIFISLVTGPCTDTLTLLGRTREMCGVPAVNMMAGASFDMSVL
jgi:hypothetical protein